MCNPPLRRHEAIDERLLGGVGIYSPEIYAHCGLGIERAGSARPSRHHQDERGKPHQSNHRDWHLEAAKIRASTIET